MRRRPPTWSSYHSLQILLWGLVLMGPALVASGLYADHRDRPSLQWPKAPGVVVQCEGTYHSRGKNSYYSADVTYTYVVNNQRHVGHQIALWAPDLHGDRGRTHEFVRAHPVKSPTEVYYDPQHPETAVLIPGPDEAGNRTFFWCGGIAFASALWLPFLMRKQLARMKANLQSAETRTRAQGPAKAAALPHGFVSYEPDCKRKLNAYPDKECLLEVLGHDGKPLQEWKPDDRVIDATGREYRLVKEADKNRYDLDATGETWNCERLLEAAQADARLLNKDPETLRRRLNDVAADEKISVLIKCIDDQPMGPRRVMAGFFLFLILFFVAVMFAAGKIFSWLQK
jgi:hypothetical protein